LGPLCSPVNLKAPSHSTTAWRKGPETASTSCLSPHPHRGQEPGLPRWRRRGVIWTPVVPQSLSRGETVLSQPPRWLNRGCSGAGALNPRLFPAPSACHPNPEPRRGVRWPLTWSRRRCSSADAEAAAKRSARSSRPHPCAWASRDPGIAHLLPLTPRPPAQRGKHAAAAASPGPALPGSSIPRTWTRCPAPPPRNVCPESRSLLQEPRLGLCPKVKSKAGPGRPGSAGWRLPPKPARKPRAARARVVGRPLHGGSKWIMSPFPLPSRDLKCKSQPFPLGGGGLSPPPLKLSLRALLTPTPPPFSVFSSSSTLFSALGHSGDRRVLPRTPQRFFRSNASPTAQGLETQPS